MPTLDHRRRRVEHRRRVIISQPAIESAPAFSTQAIPLLLNGFTLPDAIFTTQTLPLLQGALTGVVSGSPGIAFTPQHLPLIGGFGAATDLGQETAVVASNQVAQIFRVLALADGFAPLPIKCESIELSVTGIFRSTPITELRSIADPIQVSPGGIVTSGDSGSQWQSRETGVVEGSAILSVAYAPSDGTRIYAGSNSGRVLKSIDSGFSWQVTGTDPTGGAVNGLAVHPTDPDTLWAATPSGVAISTDAGDTWTLRNSGMSPAPGNGGTPLSIVIDPLDSNTLYVAGIGIGVHKTTDAGVRWTGTKTGNSRQVIIVSSSTLYARFDSAGVFKTTDSAAIWVDISTGLSSLTTQGIAFDPSDILKLYVGSASNVDRSTDGGGTWTPAGVGDGLPHTIGNYIPAVSDDGATIYAGTNSPNVVGEERVSKSVDDGVNWTDADQGFPSAVVQGFAAHPTTAARIIAVTNKDRGTGQEGWITVVIGTRNTISRRSLGVFAVPLTSTGTLAADLQTRIDAGPVSLRLQLVQVFRNSVERIYTLSNSLISRIQLPESSDRTGIVINAFEATLTEDFEVDGGTIVIDRQQVTGSEVRSGFPEISMVLDPAIRVGSTIEWDGQDFTVLVIKYDLGRVNRLQSLGTRGVLSPTSIAENSPDVTGSITQAPIPRLRARPQRALTRGVQGGG